MKFEACKECQADTMWFVFWGNTFLTAYKGVLGGVTGSAALVADAVHSLADVLSTIVTIMSIRFSNRPADAEHAYGHGKIQYVSSSLTGLLLLMGAVLIFKEAFHAIITNDFPPPNPLALFGALLSIIINEGMYRNQLCLATQINSPAVWANAWDNRSDAIASAAVMFGIAMAVLGFPLADPLAALGVSLIIAKIAIELNIEAVRGLIDTSADADELKLIYQITRKTPGVLGIAFLRARVMGESLHVEVSVQVDPKLLVYEADIIVEYLRERIKNKIGRESEVTVFLSPYAAQ
ncbi:MAG: magnetosome biogenesis CDF transporter MamB [Magnetococcales bacterium]|nr:magnetosome biogenesis CDF transporter MamB [Magnetococcales bacterium]